MSFGVVRNKLSADYPTLNTDYWESIEAALVVRFISQNIGDLHISVRRKKLYNKANKTHIDITSGNDIPPGHSPVIDFFDADFEAEKVVYSARMLSDNLRIFGWSDTRSRMWLDDNIHLRFFDRNDGGNPSAQLLIREDLLPLREAMDLGSVMIILKRRGGEYDVFGIYDDATISAAMNGKTKRMFLNPVFDAKAGVAEPVATVIDPKPPTADPKSGSARVAKKAKARRGRAVDPRVVKVVEQRGMAVARSGFEALGFLVEDVHTPELAVAAGLADFPGFDQRASGGGREYGVECKGTVSDGRSVELTFNELRAAALEADVILAVVRNITLAFDAYGQPTASGGNLAIYKWSRRDRLESFIQPLLDLCDDALLDDVQISLSSLKYAVPLDSDLVKEFEPMFLSGVAV